MNPAHSTDAIIGGAKIKVTYDPATATVRIVADKPIFSPNATHAYRQLDTYPSAIHHLSTACPDGYGQGRAWRIAGRLFHQRLVRGILVVSRQTIRFHYAPPGNAATSQLITRLLPSLIT